MGTPLATRWNSELVAACHRCAERHDMSTAAWIRTVLEPVVARELGVSVKMLQPHSGFDVGMPALTKTHRVVRQTAAERASLARAQAELNAIAERRAERLAAQRELDAKAAAEEKEEKAALSVAKRYGLSLDRYEQQPDEAETTEVIRRRR